MEKIQRGLSAGRVQSPALRLIVERELEIEKFVRQKYWTIQANLNPKSKPFQAKLTHYNGEKLDQFTLNNQQLATTAKDDIVRAAKDQLRVNKVTKRNVNDALRLRLSPRPYSKKLPVNWVLLPNAP